MGLVTRGRIELPLPAWEAGVLTAWPTGHSLYPQGSTLAFFLKALVRLRGLEPRTHWLRVSCSTNWAKGASLSSDVPSKPNNVFCTLHKALPAFIRRSSPRAISTGQLHTLLHFHLRPINQVVFLGPYSIRMRDLILGGVSRLDAFSVYHVHT